MSVSLRWAIPFLLACLAPGVAQADGTAGDDAAKKLAQAAMQKSYMAGDFDVALRKLGQAVALCKTKGCSPSVSASLQSSMAIVHWVGTEDQAAATEDLRAMVKADPTFQLDDADAPPELIAALDGIKAEAKRGAKDGGVAPTAPVVAKSAAVATAAPKSEKETAKTAEVDKAAEEKKVAAQKAADEKKSAEDKKAADEKKAAEDKKEEAKKAVEDAKKAAEEKKEAAKKAVEDAKKAAEDKREALRKEAEEKKEAAKKATEEKKEAAKKAIEDKKEAARVAAEERKAEAAKKAEEAAKKAEDERLAKIEERMRKPPPVGKLQETPWREQTKGYPIPIFVKVPTPPRGLEKPRIDVVKVVTEYATPSMSAPQQFELKALPGGGYGGLLPCDASDHEGQVTYFTRALNKYENPVAGGGTRAKPNTVVVKPVFTGSFPHLPGQLPPRTCAEEEESAKQAAAKAKEAGAKEADAGAPAPCGPNADCPDGGKAAPPAPVVPPEKPHGGCAGCQIGARSAGSLGTTFVAAAWCVWLSPPSR